MTIKTPAAFMSYVHWDDKYGQLTTLRERLSDEVQVQTGIEFPIFQDRKDIQWGQTWRERIENSLDEVTFLIPVITPGFFKSEECARELKWFLEREKKLGRNDLILPIYFIDTPLLNDAGLRATHELADTIGSRQRADWRELRFELFTNPQVGKALAKLAAQIRDALPRVQPPRKPPSKAVAIPGDQPTAVTTDEGGQQPPESPTAKREPPTRIVDPMYWGDFATLTEAVKNVDPGTRILVRPGLYQESLVIDKPLEIIGVGEAGEVVIQASGLNVIKFQTTMGRVVNLTLRQMGGQAYCVDIAQGRLQLEDCDISQGHSCVAIHGGADPRLRRNRIHDSKNRTGVIFYENAQGTLEDNDIFGNALSAVMIKEGADPTLRRNRIHDNKQGGVFVYEGGQGTFEDNDIFGNVLTGVGIKTAGNATFRRNRIYDCKEAGVFVYEAGEGTFEDNDIFGNASAGVATKSAGKPTVRNNRINKNASYAIQIYENGGGIFENNDLTENGKEAWYIDEDSNANVTRSNNKE